jgi:hypothetical protein
MCQCCPHAIVLQKLAKMLICGSPFMERDGEFGHFIKSIDGNISQLLMMDLCG